MPKAILKFNSLEGSNVDRAQGVVFGCQIAKLGKKATFRDLAGKKISIDITPRVIDGLLALLSAKEQITAHWTHGWLERGEDGLDSKVATFRNFRKDEQGNLVGDSFLWPTLQKEAILHAAEFDQKGMMISTVFDYTGGETDATPTNVQAADFVEVGASTTALCAKLAAADDTTNTTMNPTDFLTMLSDALKDPTIHAAIKAMVKEAEPDTSSAEADAGVTDADKSDSDSGTPAMMSLVRISRAIGRQIKSLGDARTAILAEAKVAAEAAAVGKVGSKAFLSQFRGEANGDLPFIALMSAHLAVNKDRATAILRAKNDNPAAYNEWEKAGRPMPSKAA